MPSLTIDSARHIRIRVITICLVFGAGLAFLMPGPTVLWFTDIEARIGFGAFAAMVQAVIGGLLGWGLAERIIHVASGNSDGSRNAESLARLQPRRDYTRR